MIAASAGPRLRWTAAAAALAVITALACSGEPPSDHTARLARAAKRGLPTDLRPELSSAWPHGTDCAAHMRDAHDPTVRLALASQTVYMESFTRGDSTFTQRWAEGEYTVTPAGRYGASPSANLRVDCSRGAAIAPPGA